MVHEIGHIFGLMHCIYYECIMNGSNGSHEDRHPDHTLCPKCLAKLKFNAKYDSKDRFTVLVEASNAIGFTVIAQNYEKLIAATYFER